MKAMSRPSAFAVKAENIPKELKARPQWVCWRWVRREGKWTKPPYQPNGRLADCTNPIAWSNFDSALAAYQDRTQDFDGIGFVLTRDDPYTGIDLDHCVATDKSIKQHAIRIIEQLNSYAEFSPSGTGVRIIVCGKLPPGRRKSTRLRIEMYDTDRYLTLTGHVLKGSESSKRA